MPNTVELVQTELDDALEKDQLELPTLPEVTLRIREIDDLQQAIGRIGVGYAANLADGLAIENMFQANSELVDRKLRSVWTRACEVAAISGVPPILTFAEDNPSLIRDSFALDQIIENLHGKIGMKILQHWDFSDDLILVPGHYLDFDRHVAGADFVDLVMVSYLQTRFGSEHPRAAVNWADVPAFRNIGLDPDFEDAELEEYHEDVATAKVMLI
jgi:HD-like signal output (HDOD) protein